MKKIIGLDLGTTSIGWAFVKEAENDNEQSSIERIGVRVNPLTTDEQTNFEKGKPVSVNADRTLKRGARRNLQRYKQRRENLLQVLKQHHIIGDNTILAENAKSTTHSTYALRAKAATKEITLEEFARILLMLNKKRGYKSSRKAKNEEEGQLIDGMTIAKKLYDDNLTPGQLCYAILKEGKKYLPDFYRSDLQAEFDKVWNFQKQFYPDIFTDEFKKEIDGKGQRATAASFWNKYKFNTADIKGTREEKKLIAYHWRSKAFAEQLSKEEAAYVITEINSNINNSSGYLGAISDRSKELYFNKQTVGQYLYAQLLTSPHTRMKNQVFYRQDYFDEFEIIWQTQAVFHKELSPELKNEIRDIIIFYQRRLKSQKGLVSFCEFESKEIEVEENGKVVKKMVGYKVSPKSSPLFQEFKIWQILNHLEAQNIDTKETFLFDQEAKELLFKELNTKGNISKDTALVLLGYNPKKFTLNFNTLEGSRTNEVLYDVYFKMMELEGHEEIEDWKLLSTADITSLVSSFFETQDINLQVLCFDCQLEGSDFEKQAAYQLWHLLYSYEGDESKSGNEKLYELLSKKFGFKKEYAQLLAGINLQQDYGSLSAKAMRNILPYLMAGHPFSKNDKDDKSIASATALAGYRHSALSLTKEEIENKILLDKLELLPKNSLRNPVVEKILNQMVNVVNAIIADTEMGRPDEIRIELARELKKNAKEREEMTAQINKSKGEHDTITKKIIADFGIKNPTRNDIIRYKLYDELACTGYKNLYTNEYIQYERLFSKDYDIDHIIPQASLFDDSFSNKTLVPRQVNLDKGNRTAYDFIAGKYGDDVVKEFEGRIDGLLKFYQKERPTIRAKCKKLLKKGDEIGEGFIERDLRNSQYIAKKARLMLLQICKTVVPTSGSVTDYLREDWGLINVMQELNIDKYRKLGLTEMIEKKDGSFKEKIKDWTKRNDHRHHAMDALTVAFTKHSHIQFLNNLNARIKEDKLGKEIKAIEQKETYLYVDDSGKRQRKFKSPIPNFREEAKKHLEAVLISFKAKNKVATKNKNKVKGKENPQETLTPRGQLHKETVYGKLHQYATKEEKIGAKFNEAMIQQVASPKIRMALLQRLKANDNDPKKAFTGKNSLDKNPIYVGVSNAIQVPEKIKLVTLDPNYTIRKDVTPDLKVDKVIDVGVRRILEARLTEFKGNSKEAFSNLDKNPIWLNKDKGIDIKRVTISGVSNAEPLHYKKDHLGQEILNEKGNKIPVDYVSTGNNHHVAIYRDAEGNLQDNVVSFYEAVERVNQMLPVIDKALNKEQGWQFLFTMKQNEYFVFPSESFDPSEIDLTSDKNRMLISPHLFRVQKFSKLIYGNSAVREYVFRHHLETSVDDNKELKEIAFKNIKSLSYFEKIIKVRINHIGQIVKVGEY